MKELLKLVARHGLELHGDWLDDQNVSGYWSPSEGRIYFDMRLTPSERRSTVAHELGHHHFGHDCSTDLNERQADTYAANLLIDPVAYEAAARIDRSRAAIAEELHVEEYLVEAYEEYCLVRVGETVYRRGRWGSTHGAFW